MEFIFAFDSILIWVLNNTQVVPVDVIPELAKLASSTLLQMLVNLRLWYKNVSAAEANSASSQKMLSNGSSAVPLALGPKINTLSLKYILKNIVDWIIISGEASQKLKINLYASLLNFVHIVKRLNAPDTSLDEIGSAET